MALHGVHTYEGGSCLGTVILREQDWFLCQVAVVIDPKIQLQSRHVLDRHILVARWLVRVSLI